MTEQNLPPWALRKLLDAGNERKAPGIERFEILREIGRGGMGTIYEAFDSHLDRRVALKVMHTSVTMDELAAERFLREAKAAARINHPNIAQVYDASEQYIAMEFIEGASLAEAPVRDGRRLGPLMRDAALALQAAHERGVVHRDIKPSNLMNSDGHIYVLDFGLAKEWRNDTSLSRSGSVLGTPAYMSPEQASGKLTSIGPWSDIYSLGATMFDQLTGQPPFVEENPAVLLREIVERDPPHVRKLAPDVNVDLATIVMKCLEKDPARRYEDAQHLADDIDRWLRGHPIQARPPSINYRTSRFVSRHRTSLGLAVAILVVVIGLVVKNQSARRAKAAASDSATLSQSMARLAETANFLKQENQLPTGIEEVWEGIATCRELAERTGAPHANFNLGSLTAAVGDVATAEAALERVLVAEPDHLRARVERGMMRFEQIGEEAALSAMSGERLDPVDHPMAIDTIEDLISVRRDPTQFVARREAQAEAAMHWLSGDYTAAIKGFDALLELDRRDFFSRIARLQLAAWMDDAETFEELQPKLEEIPFKAWDQPIFDRRTLYERILAGLRSKAHKLIKEPELPVYRAVDGFIRRQRALEQEAITLALEQSYDEALARMDQVVEYYAQRLREDPHDDVAWDERRRVVKLRRSLKTLAGMFDLPDAGAGGGGD